jgi:amidohydrolase
MEEISELKKRVCAEIDELGPELIATSHKIHANPEVMFKEFESAEMLEELLEKYGFAVEKGVAGMPTAFRAVKEGTSPRPAIAILGEYDALPGVGHACGHNIIGTAAAGAGIALSKLLGEMPGSVHILGCPAEEGGGGKIIMVQKGLFEGVDAALMTHPMSGKSMIGGPNLATVSFTVKYYGKAAHSAAQPHEGVNALDAIMLAFQAINALRQHVLPDVRIHGYIKFGGDAANVVPDYSEASFIVRSARQSTLQEVAEKVRKCFEAGAIATGARLELVEGMRYAERVVNYTVARTLQANMRALGVEVLEEPVFVSGSTDFGLVSQVVPAANAYMGIAPEKVASHSIEFCEASKSPAGDWGLLTSTKAMAMTAIDLIMTPGLMNRAWKEQKDIMAHK